MWSQFSSLEEERVPITKNIRKEFEKKGEILS